MRVSQSDIDNLVKRINASMGVSLMDRPIGGSWVVGSYVVDYCGLQRIENELGGTRTVVQWGISCPKSTQQMILSAFLQGITTERSAVKV